MILAVAVVAALLATVNEVRKYSGPRDGSYYGSYGYLGTDWRWHEVRGNVIFVRGGVIITD